MYHPSSPQSARSTSPYPLSTSRSHTGIGSPGFMNSPFLQANDYRPTSPSRRSPLSTPTSPTGRSHLFEDLPHGLYNRYNDAHEYLRTRHTFSPPRTIRRSTPSSSAYSTYTPSSYYSSDWYTPSTRSYSRSSSRYPDSTYESLPTTPYTHSRTSTPFTPRERTPTKSSINTTTVLSDRPISPVVYVPTSRPSSRMEAPSTSPILHVEDKESLLKVTDHVTHELDKKVHQADRFLHELDDMLSEIDKNRKGIFDREETPKISIHIEEDPPRKRPEIIQEEPMKVKTKKEERKASVFELEIQSEEQLMEAVRKSREPSPMIVASTPAFTEPEVRKRVVEFVPEITRKTNSSPGFESTVSSHEIRMKESPKQEEDVLKQYLPWIIGGIILLFVIISLISNARSAKKISSKVVVDKTKSISSSVAKASDKLQKSIKSLKDPSLGVKELVKEIKETSKGMKEMSKSISEAASKVKEVSKGFSEVSKTAKEVARGVKEVMRNQTRNAKAAKVMTNVTETVKLANVTVKSVKKVSNTTVKIAKTPKVVNITDKLVKVTVNATQKAVKVKK